MIGLLKKSMAVLLCVIMVCTNFIVPSHGATKISSAWDGSTKTEPVVTDGVYQIENGAQLAWLADYVLAGNTTVKAELTADIDLGSKEWTPIGNNSKKFAGSFDGNGYAIHNLSINSETNYIGLFGYLGGGATITDLSIDGSIQSSYENNGAYAGAIAGYGSGSNSKPINITNVHTDCDISVKGSSYGSYAGGIVGYSGTKVIIQNCSNTGDVAGIQKAVGGIAGSGKNIINCYNSGTISGTTCVGGIAGLGSTEEIRNCYNAGNIIGTNFVGGIAAAATAIVIPVNNCYNVGTVEIIGDLQMKDNIVASAAGQVSNCYTTGDVEDSYYGFGKFVTADEMRNIADELGEAFVVNIHEEYNQGYPVLAWETETDAFKELSKKAITYVTAVTGSCVNASVKYGTEMNEKMYEVLGMAEEVILKTNSGQVIVPATWEGHNYVATQAGVYAFTPVYELPAGATSSGANIQVVQVTVREEGAKAPVVTDVQLNDKILTQVEVKYGRTQLGLPTHVKAIIDGEEKQVYVDWEMPEGFSTTGPGVYVAKAYFPEEYELADDVTMPAISVKVKEQGFLSSLKFSNVSRGLYYDMTPEFDELVREYTVYVPDTKGTFYCEPVLDESVGSGTIKAIYTNTNSKSTTKALTSGNSTNITQFVRVGSSQYAANDNTASIEVTAEDGSVQTYVVNAKRLRSLSSMEITANGSVVNYEPAFSGETFEYTANVVDATTGISLTVKAGAKDSQLAVSSDAVNELIDPESDGSYTIELASGDITTIKIQVCGEAGSGARDYYLTIKKVRTAKMGFRVNPQATVVVKDSYGVRVLEAEDGKFHLLEGESYTYSVSKNGYLSQKGEFVAAEGTKVIDLVEAVINTTIPTDMTAAWPNFAKNPENNAVVSAKTPISASGASLYWSVRLGAGYGGKATGAPLIVDDCIISTANTTIFKVDRFTGEVITKGEMCAASTFSIVPPTYADGMIFVGLSNGTIQAFNAETLESLWIFKDELKGQPNSPIKYYNGYVYTGFWNSETKEANFVCVSTTDEDITVTDEEKIATWTHAQPGGFYWAGAYVCDNYVLVGTDDGDGGYTESTSELLSLDPQSGKVIDRISGLNADIRSSVCYDTVTDRYYVTSKGGSFYGFAVNEDGTFKKDANGVQGFDLKEISLGGMSTSTPVVHNGRAYVGVSGTGQFSAGSGSGIVVIDLASWTIAYKAETVGYPQTSGLLTTGYDEDGYVYVYFLDNQTPGWMRYVKDKPGVTEVLDPYVVQNGDSLKKYAPILFTPSGEHVQYAICTPIVDEYGTLYFKNDSAFMMAVGSTIEKIQVDTLPVKTAYKPGEDFEASGMAVYAYLSNGMKRDITKYVEVISGEALQEGRKEVTIKYADVLYHDTDRTVSGVSVHESGVEIDPLYTTVSISVGEDVPVTPPVVDPVTPPVVVPATEPTVNPVTEPTVKPVTEPTVKPVTEPTVKPVTEPTVKPVTPPVVNPVTEPTVKPVTEPTVKPVTEPTVKPVTEPTVKPVTEPTVKPVTEPTVKPATEPTVKPVTEPTVKPVTEPTVKPVTEPTVKPVTPPVVKPVTPPVASVPVGDANLDGTLNLKDAQLVLRAALLLEELNEQQRKVADVNKDGEVSLQDAQLVLRGALLLVDLEKLDTDN